MDFRSPSRTSTASPAASVGMVCDLHTVFHVPPPVGSAAPPTLPARGIHFPARPSSSGSHRLRPAPPRRGLPHPLWSAFAVSHDLDGLPLLEPGDLFQPLTPMGFGLPAPHHPTRRSRPEDPIPSRRRRSGDRPKTLSCPTWGVGTRARSYRSVIRPNCFPGLSPGFQQPKLPSTRARRPLSQPVTLTAAPNT
jgi:hypothetical protein